MLLQFAALKDKLNNINGTSFWDKKNVKKLDFDQLQRPENIILTAEFYKIGKKFNIKTKRVYYLSKNYIFYKKVN